MIMDLTSNISVEGLPSREGGDGRLNKAALTALLVLVGGTVLYPDTFIESALYVGPARLSPLGVLFALTAPLLIFIAWRRRRYMRARPVDAVLFASITFIAARGVLAAENANELGLVLAFAAYILVLYYGTGVLGQTGKLLPVIYLFLAGVGGVVIALALLEFVLGWNFPYSEMIKETVWIPSMRNFHRTGSTLAHPIALGLFMAQFMPFLVFLYATARKRIARIAWGVLVVAGVIVLQSTYTKGSWITVGILGAVAVVWLAWREPRSRKPMAVLLASSAVAVILFTAINLDDFRDGVFSQPRMTESFVPRKYMWSKTPEAFVENLLFGTGMWHGAQQVALVEPDEDDVKFRTLPETIDNLYLTILVEQGVVGSLLLISTLALIGWQSVRLIRPWGNRAYWTLPLAFSMAALLINGMTNDSMMIWPGMVLFWLCAGLLRAIFEMDSSSEDNEPGHAGSS